MGDTSGTLAGGVDAKSTRPGTLSSAINAAASIDAIARSVAHGAEI
jgi:hypothetical protein